MSGTGVAASVAAGAAGGSWVTGAGEADVTVGIEVLVALAGAGAPAVRPRAAGVPGESLDELEEESARGAAVRFGVRVTPDWADDRGPGDDAELVADPVAPSVSATAAAGIAATHAPMPRATASAPILPT